MKLYTLADWLTYIASIHAKPMDLGLERVKKVAQRLSLKKPRCPVVIVGGTNGKGSTVAGLEAIYRAQGYRTGCFTTPFIFKHNEQVRLNGVDAPDNLFCEAFELVEAARQEITLTQFEFNTLAALLIFKKQDLDVWILEVGLGGRLDAVNILDADLAIVTSISLDHTQILGDTREKIAYEKAGIFRPNQPAICGDPEPPQSLLNYAQQIGTKLYIQKRDFNYRDGNPWQWETPSVSYRDLPQTQLATQNMSTVLMAISLLQSKLMVSDESIKRGLKAVTLPGRIQIKKGAVTEIIDVAHNEASIALLAGKLEKLAVKGKRRAIFSMLADKAIEKCIATIESYIDVWYVAPLQHPRSETSENLAHYLQGKPTLFFSDIHTAYQQAKKDSQVGDVLIVFGSFYTVSAALSENSAW